MSVNVEIKLEKMIPIQEIAGQFGLQYGVSDRNYCLEIGEVGDHMILYDPQKIGRGIEVSYEGTTLLLKMPLPTTKHEIKLFYDMIVKICIQNHVKEFIRDDEKMLLINAYNYLNMDIQITIDTIKQFDEKLKRKEQEGLFVFGALYPIYLGIDQFNEINGSIDNFENFLHRLQEMDAYYANPRFYQRQDGTVFGIYTIGDGIVSIVPTEAYAPFQQIDELDSWYVIIPEHNAIPYEDFIKHIEKIQVYDNTHIVIKLDSQTIRYLAENYAVNYTTKQKVTGYYWGKWIDDGHNHSRKIKDKNLACEELAGFNHLAVFLRWSYEHDLLSDIFLAKCLRLSQVIAEQEDLRKYMIDEPAIKGKIMLDYFKDEVKGFVESFYKFGNVGYPDCVDKYAESVLGSEKYNCEEYQDEAYLFVEYNEEYYYGLSKYIDEVWKERV